MLSSSLPAGAPIPALTVCRWPIVTCAIDRAPELQLVHMNTCILTAGDGDTPSCGQTLWADPTAAGSTVAGVAWDWVQIQEGIVAMADPFGLVTNLHLVGDHGKALSSMEVTLRLNALVQALPWQSEVQRALAHTGH